MLREGSSCWNWKHEEVNWTLESSPLTVNFFCDLWRNEKPLWFNWLASMLVMVQWGKCHRGLINWNSNFMSLLKCDPSQTWHGTMPGEEGLRLQMKGDHQRFFFRSFHHEPQSAPEVSFFVFKTRLILPLSIKAFGKFDAVNYKKKTLRRVHEASSKGKRSHKKSVKFQNSSQLHFTWRDISSWTLSTLRDEGEQKFLSSDDY